MAKKAIRRRLGPSLSLLLLLGSVTPSIAQLVVGQYEEEAPLRTWNVFGFQTAAVLGRGETSFAGSASDASVALTNPALLADLPGLTLTLSGMAMSASLRKYSIVNTGVLATEGNISLSLYGVDMAGISFSRGGWAASFHVYLSEIYDRPPANYEYFYRGRLYYRISFNQEGLLRIYNFSLARKVGRRFRAGIGLNFARGELRRQTEEEWAVSGILIRDRKDLDFSGFFVNGGLAVRASEKLDVALVFRTPYRKNSPGESELVYDPPPGGTDITISATATNRYDQPLVVGAGVSYAISRRIRMAADGSFFNWENYRVWYFGEEMERNFRNTIKAAVGAEAMLPFRMFGKEAVMPIRLGLTRDEQPMKEPRSAYTLLTVGGGLHWQGVLLDLGASLGRENGSGDKLEVRRIALSLTLRLF